MKKILMVCLGNICRSPLAEGIMRSKVEKYKISALIDSAGTANYHVGENPDHRSVACAKKNGIDISTFKGKQFSVKDFDVFDLIYVMDSSNYSDVLLLSRNEEDKKKVKLILNEVNPNKNNAVPDPYWGGEKEFEDVFKMLDEACEQIVKNIFKDSKTSI